MEQVIGKINQMESRLESQMGQMRWFIGGAIAVVGILVPVILRLLH